MFLPDISYIAHYIVVLISLSGTIISPVSTVSSIVQGMSSTISSNFTINKTVGLVLPSSSTSTPLLSSTVIVQPTIDPCNASKCQANSTCINLGNNKSTCRCNDWFYLRADSCKAITYGFESTMRISSMKYEDDLSNRYSRIFVEKAAMIEKELLPTIQVVVPNVIAIKLSSFKNGSVLVNFHIILDEKTKILKNTETMIKKAIIGNANTSQMSFGIDPSFDPAVSNINKCLSNDTNNCHELATCSPGDRGSYTCKCKAHYVGNGTYCADLNECLGENNCHRNATCTNTIGSYYCTCNKNDGGVDFEGNGTFCKDMNKCISSDTNNCHKYARCINLGEGNYTCECNIGFNGTGTYCEDINECLAEDICHRNATCTNVLGSYICTCNKNDGGSDFDGDGKYCREICPSNLCLDISEICVKQNSNWTCECTKGSYRGPSDEHCFVVHQEIVADDGLNTAIWIAIVAGIIGFAAVVTIIVTFIHYVPKM